MFDFNLGGEIKATKGQVATENVQLPKLVVHKGQKGPRPQGNKLVLWPLANNQNNRGHPSKLWLNLSPKPKLKVLPPMVGLVIRAEHALEAPWKCVLMSALRFRPEFLELV